MHDRILIEFRRRGEEPIIAWGSWGDAIALLDAWERGPMGTWDADEIVNAPDDDIRGDGKSISVRLEEYLDYLQGRW